jgi:integrase
MAAARRSYGTGSLYVRTDAAGREAWYDHWRSNGRQVKRKVGAKRAEGDRDGLTRRQAEAELRRLIAEVTATRPAGERLGLSDVAARYQVDLKRRGRKPSTLLAVDLAVRVHLAPFFGDRALDAIRPEDVESLMGKMESDGLSPKTIRNYIGTLSAIFNYARGPHRRWASSNPCEGLELPERAQETEIRFLDLAELDALIDTVPAGEWQRIDRAMFLAAAMTGLRQGELIALRWRDIDWPAGRVRVRQNYVRGAFGTPKSRRSTRSVPLADRVAGELDRLYTARYGDREEGDHADELVFPSVKTGGPQERSKLFGRFRKAAKAAHLDESRVFHDLRHTFGTQMASAGVPLRTLQEWMGHRDLTTTQIYADYAPNPHEAELVEAAFAPRGSNSGSNLSEPQST